MVKVNINKINRKKKRKILFIFFICFKLLIIGYLDKNLLIYWILIFIENNKQDLKMAWEIKGTVGSLESLPNITYQSRVSAPKNPKLIRENKKARKVLFITLLTL